MCRVNENKYPMLHEEKNCYKCTEFAQKNVKYICYHLLVFVVNTVKINI